MSNTTTSHQQGPSAHLLANSKLCQVGSVLRTLVHTGDQLGFTEQAHNVTPFHSAVAPEIAIDWYFILLCVNSGL